MKKTHEELHERALATAREYLKREAELVGIFQELDQNRTFERYGMPSLFAYATKLLGLSEATTTALTSIARAARKVPELKTAIEEKKITLSNARRITPVLVAENKAEWLEKAASLPLRKLEFELAKSFPDKPEPTRVYPKSETLGRLEIDLPNSTLAKLKRAQEILSQKKKTNIDAAAALAMMLEEFIDRYDPVEKAKRAMRKGRQNQTQPLRKPVARPVTITPPLPPELHALARQMGFSVPRTAVPAREKHAATLRDGGQCTHLFLDGVRCDLRQWLDLHHVKTVARGGGDFSDNLRTLCAAHHELAHRSC